MDHKLLLLKYIDFVVETTGDDFIWWADDRFTNSQERFPSRFKKEEWRELQELSDAVHGINDMMEKMGKVDVNLESK